MKNTNMKNLVRNLTFLKKTYIKINHLKINI